MTRYKLTENFFLDEFVCPEIHAVRGQNAIELLDMRIVLAVQFIREETGVAIHMNDWATGGHLKERGLRRFDTLTGAKLSQHKYGRAADISASGMTIAQLLDFVKSHESTFIERGWITTYENPEATPTWLHIDCRHTGLDKLHMVNP